MSAWIKPAPTGSQAFVPQVVSQVMVAGAVLSQIFWLPVPGIGNADDFRIDSMIAGVRLGFYCSISAATDVTCGVAIEVPPT